MDSLYLTDEDVYFALMHGVVEGAKVVVYGIYVGYVI
jgi:hypothetical protein